MTGRAPGLEPKVGIGPTIYALPSNAPWAQFRSLGSYHRFSRELAVGRLAVAQVEGRR
jgi:hypothetical protein